MSVAVIDAGGDMPRRRPRPRENEETSTEHQPKEHHRD